MYKSDNIIQIKYNNIKIIIVHILKMCALYYNYKIQYLILKIS